MGGPVDAARDTGVGKPTVPDDTVVYAVGDIHGRADLLDRLHQSILEDSQTRQAARRTVIYLGDYIDRGPESFRVVETLAAGAPPGFEAVYLKGNHEAFLLDFLAEPERASAWLFNGGVETLRSYGVTAPERGNLSEILPPLQLGLAAALPDMHRRFFEGLALSHVEGDYYFVHAGVRPGRPLATQVEQDMLWIRDAFLHSSQNFGKIVVHGHSINWDPQIKPNRIGIDTGAFASGVLTALVLEGDRRNLIQT